MDMWAGDPWDDTRSEDAPKPELPELENGSADFLAGFEDDAGWGESESSVDNNQMNYVWNRVEERLDGPNYKKSNGGEAEMRTGNPFAPSLTSPGWNDTLHPPSPSEVIISSRRSWDNDILEDNVVHEPENLKNMTQLNIEGPASDNAFQDESTRATTPIKFAGCSPNCTGPFASFQSSQDSIEDARAPDDLWSSIDASYADTEHWQIHQREEDPKVPLPELLTRLDKPEDDDGDFEEKSKKDGRESSLASSGADNGQGHRSPDSPSRGNESLASTRGRQGNLTSIAHPHFDYDLALLGEIFKKPQVSGNPTSLQEQIISTNSAGQFWYRITRPITLRAFNEGSFDDNSVRVSWPRSIIKKQVIKVVTRWTSEDRIHERIMFDSTIPSRGSSVLTEAPSDPSHVARERGMSNPDISSTSLADRPSIPAEVISSSTTKRRPSANSQGVAEETAPIASFSWSSSRVTQEPSAQEMSNDSSYCVGSLIESSAADFQPGSARRVNRPDISHTSRSISVSQNSRTAPSPVSHRRSATVDHSIAKSAWKVDSIPRTSVGSSSMEFDVEVPSTSDLHSDFTHGDLKSRRRHENSTSALKFGTAWPSWEAEEEDQSWGDMMTCPSSLSSPAISRAGSQSMMDASVTETCTPENKSQKPKKRPPLLPSFKNQPVVSPSSLSPARKAAFEAARVTRSLSSQQPHHSISTTDEQMRKFPHIFSEFSSTLLANPANSSDVKVEVMNRVQAPSRPSSESMLTLLPSPISFSGSTLLPASTTYIGADLSSISDISRPATPILSSPSKRISASSTEDENLSQRIISSLPDLSYMLQ